MSRTARTITAAALFVIALIAGMAYTAINTLCDETGPDW